ncbi:(E)-beta-ocimene synthase, chloroplastic-like [Bidens hawaiensis]|uniref:(E)-beta-ocimene synthase, chloroplastic-like n=1 Tax=Bidens hawaiensis TaxID=980011 RepID=UPI0040493F4D
MALIFSQFSLPLSLQRKKAVQIVTHKGREQYKIICKANNKVLQTKNRVSTYQQTSWTPDFIENLESNVSMNLQDMVELKKLEEKVGAMLFAYENGCSTLQLLELVDDIERLGLGYRFQDDITRVLDKVASINESQKEDELYASSLKFRLLRDHGYSVSQDFLKRFKDSHGRLIGCLKSDVKAVLSVYEASFLALESELDLQEAKLLAKELLLKLSGNINDEVTENYLNLALDTPLYRMVQRLQARWHIDIYSKRKDANNLLLELAILDFNMVQSSNTRDLQQVSKWWENIELSNQLGFIRDRLMECFFWGSGMIFQPRYDSCRIVLTKVCALITSFDDIYDIWESVDELEVLTNAIKRWDANAVERLPLRLQVGFLALYNSINRMACDTLIIQGKYILPTLAKVWGELCESFLLEAKWTEANYMPTLEEYLDNAWVSASGVVILTHGYLSLNQEDTIESLEKCQELFKWSSMLLRLYNDTVISSEEIARGESANAVSCYMRDNDVSEDVAREYVNTLIDKAWMKMIKARNACYDISAYPIIDVALNLARVAQSMYQFGDGHGAPDARANYRVLSTIVKPITIKEEKQGHFS